MWFLLQLYCLLTEIGLGEGDIIGNVESKQGDEGEKEEFTIVNLGCSEEKYIIYRKNKGVTKEKIHYLKKKSYASLNCMA